MYVMCSRNLRREGDGLALALSLDVHQSFLSILSNVSVRKVPSAHDFESSDAGLVVVSKR